MINLADSFMQEVTTRINNMKDLRRRGSQEIQAKRESDHTVSSTKHQGTPQGIPPPDDLNCSISSISSSFLSIPDAPACDNLILIKDKNREIRRAASIAIKNFRTTSKDLLSISQINSGNTSVILGELETMKKNLYRAADEYRKSRTNLSISNKSIADFESCDLEEILSKIQDIQREINDATQKLMDSEKLIQSTEENNLLLENRIKKIEENMNSLAVTEGPERNENGMCLCTLF